MAAWHQLWRVFRADCEEVFCTKVRGKWSLSVDISTGVLFLLVSPWLCFLFDMKLQQP